MNVLIADDNSTNLKLLRVTLEADGLTVFDAADGEKALALMEHEKVDAIISDILMPNMDGYRFCYEVRASERFHNLPFIFYTATYTSPSDEKLSLELGADSFLRKPASAKDIVRSLHAALQRPARPLNVLEQPQELSLMKEYNGLLVKKLEHKNEELLKRTDELHSSVAQLRLQATALETAANAVILTDPTGIILWANPAFTKMTGYALEEAIGKSPGLLKSGQHGPAFYGDLWQTILAGKAWAGEFTNRRKDGSLYYGDQTITPVLTNDGVITHFVGIMNDVTARKQAEEALGRTANLLRAVADGTPDAVFVKDLQGRYLLFNEAAARFVGRPAAEVIGKDDAALFDLEGAQRVMASDLAVRESGQTQINEERLSAAGVERLYLATKAPYRDSHGTIIGTIGISHDITERSRIEHELRASERRFREMLENVELIAMTLDLDGRITFCNDCLLRVTGQSREQVIGQDWFALFIPETDMALRKMFDDTASIGEIPAHHENPIKTKAGELREIAWNNTTLRDGAGNIIGVASLGEDITERRLHERHAIRSQRLESLGTLAGGVAHDLNNALSPILMGMELLKMRYPAESNIIDMFQTSAKRGADMVRQLLTFAKGAEGERASIPPARLVAELENMMKGSFPKNIHLIIHTEPDLPTVLGDATQVHQVLLNLCVNARDAMPHGGTLTLEALCMDVDAAYASAIPDARPGRHVVLRVRDTGTGIPPNIIDRIFDPFFTTKGPDKGTGLGLSTVLGIVKGHGGFLHVYSEPGQGSTFAAYLPAEQTGSNVETTHMGEPTTRSYGRGETVLIVDDEALVREMGQEVLQRLNFKPLTAMDGADGLIQVASHLTDLRLIITDLHMPHMDGLTFVRVVRRMLPDIPIVISSGRLEEPQVGEFAELGVKSRLDKPFTELQLADTLMKLLAPQ